MQKSTTLFRVKKKEENSTIQSLLPLYNYSKMILKNILKELLN